MRTRYLRNKIILLEMYLKLTLCFLLSKWGAPPGGCSGTAGSGVTVCMGRGGFKANFFKLAIRLSHINDTSSILCRTLKRENKFSERKIIKLQTNKSIFSKIFCKLIMPRKNLTKYFIDIFKVPKINHTTMDLRKI